MVVVVVVVVVETARTDLPLFLSVKIHAPLYHYQKKTKSKATVPLLYWTLKEEQGYFFKNNLTQTS